MEIEKAFKKLLIQNPFYGLFCLSLPKVITNKINTLSISKQGVNCQLNINPDYWNTLKDEEQVAVLTHELSHICLKHMFLADSFPDKNLFNIAADAEVNSYIQNLPSGGVSITSLNQRYNLSLTEGMGTKKYYEEIQNALNQQKQQAQAKNPSRPCNGGLGGTPQSSSPSSATPNDSDEEKEQQPPSPPQKEKPLPSEPQSQPEKEEKQYPDEIDDDYTHVDDHSSWKEFQQASEAVKQLISNNINATLKSTAEQVERSRGTIPAELTEIIEKLKKKKPEVFNWKAYFRRLLGSIYDVNIKSTRRKESKRFSGSAGIQHKKKVSILVAVDTSGSVSSKELQDFFSEIDYVYKAGARVTIVECDARINSITEYDGKTLPEIKGRGGTDFNPPVNYYVEHKKEYASLIYFTDGECDLPKKNPSGIIWVITPNGYHQDYPGKTLYMPKEQNE